MPEVPAHVRDSYQAAYAAGYEAGSEAELEAMRTPAQRKLSVLIRHRAHQALTEDEHAIYGPALETCQQGLDGSCPLEGQDVCDRQCTFRWLD
jgi:hypothetical protein